MLNLRYVTIFQMSVEISIPQFLQHLVSNKEIVNVTGNTVDDCLNDLIRQFPDLQSKLFTKKAQLQKHLEVFINGKTAYPDELIKPVRDGDKLLILNIINGG